MYFLMTHNVIFPIHTNFPIFQYRDMLCPQSLTKIFKNFLRFILCKHVSITKDLIENFIRNYGHRLKRYNQTKIFSNLFNLGFW